MNFYQMILSNDKLSNCLFKTLTFVFLKIHSRDVSHQHPKVNVSIHDNTLIQIMITHLLSVYPII